MVKLTADSPRWRAANRCDARRPLRLPRPSNPVRAAEAEQATGVDAATCHAYLAGLEYHLGWKHLAGLAEFFRRLSAAGRVPDGGFAFLPA